MCSEQGALGCMGVRLVCYVITQAVVRGSSPCILRTSSSTLHIHSSGTIPRENIAVLPLGIKKQRLGVIG